MLSSLGERFLTNLTNLPYRSNVPSGHNVLWLLEYGRSLPLFGASSRLPTLSTLQWLKGDLTVAHKDLARWLSDGEADIRGAALSLMGRVKALEKTNLANIGRD